jgi:hypothetical protein
VSLGKAPNANPIVEVDVERLRSLSIHDLRAVWRKKFKSEPPKAFRPDLLRRSVAYRIQDNAYGGLDDGTQRLMSQLIAQHTKTPGKIVMPRRLLSWPQMRAI